MMKDDDDDDDEDDNDDDDNDDDRSDNLLTIFSVFHPVVQLEDTVLLSGDGYLQYPRTVMKRM